MKRIILALCLFALPSSAEAFSQWVSKSGVNSNACFDSATQPANLATQTRLTIAAGIACIGSGGGTSGAGDSVNVLAGVYVENLHELIPGGTAGNPFVLKSVTKWGAIIRPTAQIDGIRQTIATNHVTIDGFDVDGINTARVTGHEGIVIKDVPGRAGWTLKNLRIRNWGCDGLGGIWAGAIIQDNEFDGNGGLYDQGFGQGLEDGICHGAYVEGANVIFERNVLKNNVHGYGLHIYTGALATNWIIRYNTFFGNGSGGAFIAGTGHLVHSNLSYNNTFEGYDVGIGSGPATNVRMYNNTAYGNGDRGIRIRSSTGTDSTNNLLIGNSVNYENLGGGTNTANNQVTTGTAASHFVDATNANFNLKAGSTAIGTGFNVTTAVVPLDIVGTARTVPFDVGAYKSTPGGGGPTCPSNTLVASYALTTNANDGSGNANHGTPAIGVTIPATGYSEGALFNSSLHTIIVPHSASLYLPCGWTLEAWVRPASTITTWTGLIVFPYDTSDGPYLYGGDVSGTPLAGFSVSSMANSFVYGVTLPPATWTHIASVRDPTLATGSQTLFLNAAAVTNGSGTSTLADWSGVLRFGNSQFGESFTGVMARIKIYNYARTQSEIKTDMGAEPIPSIPSTPTAVRIGTGTGALKCGTGAGACKFGVGS